MKSILQSGYNWYNKQRMLLFSRLKGNEIIRNSLWVILSAFVSNLSYPEFNFYWVQFFSLAPFIYVISNVKSYKLAIYYSSLFGVVFHCILLYWLKIFHPLSLPGILLGYFVYFSLFGVIIKLLIDQFPKFKNLIIPSFWVSFEYIRSSGFLGFPWGLTAHSQWNFLPFIQIADTFGIWIISFLVVLVNVICLEIFLCYRRKESIKNLIYALFIIMILPLIYGFIKINIIKHDLKNAPSIKIALIQSDVNPRLSSEKIKYQALSRLTYLSQKANLENPDLIVWSETAILEYIKYYHDNYERLKEYPALTERLLYTRDVMRLAKDLQAYIFTGIPHYERYYVNKQLKEDEFNSAILIDPQSQITDIYYKIHLVPFGEWFPYRIPFINKILEETWAGNWTPGQRYTIFKLMKDQTLYYFSALICYEGIFGDLCRQFILHGAEFLINITNDSWSFTHKAEYQHLIADIFRTVENRIPYVRCANSGVTCLINQYGKVMAQSPLFKQTYLVDYIKIIKNSKPTIYTQYGDYLPRILLIFNLLLLCYTIVKSIFL